MTKNTPAAADSSPLSTHLHLHAMRDASAFSGAIAGVAVGAIAGPVGALAGGLLGTAIGAFTGQTLDDEGTRLSAHDELLDRAIGVSQGNMGAAAPNQPRATRGTYSGASAGASSEGGVVPSEGPMQDLDTDS